MYILRLTLSAKLKNKKQPCSNITVVRFNQHIGRVPVHNAIIPFYGVTELYARINVCVNVC